MLQITIDGQNLDVEGPITVLAAALDAGMYIPHLCYHPATGATVHRNPNQRVYQGGAAVDGHADKEHTGCNLCLVEIEGQSGNRFQNACSTDVENGMVIHTDSEAIRAERIQHLTALMEKYQHPTACVTCAFSEGCDRKICSMDTPEPGRCCYKYHRCELRQVAAYIGLPDGLRYERRQSVQLKENPVFSIDYTLCIGCMRCVAACERIAKRGALDFVYHNDTYVVGTIESDLKESGCKFCLVCADLCPTGAIRENKKKKKKSKLRESLPPSILPPSQDTWVALNVENINNVPETEGVYRLCDKDKQVVQITGTADLNGDLTRELENSDEPLYFHTEIDPMFMMRERQLIQQHLERFGDLPEKNKELDDLF